MRSDETDERPGRDERRRGRYGHREGGRRGGRRGGWQAADVPPADDAAEWLTGRLPDEWFSGIEVVVDREEITVIGTLADTQTEGASEGAAVEGRIDRFREDTRGRRMQIADEAEARYARKVAWGVRHGDVEALFTHLAVPVMTRLRQPERRVLDTLVDAGVARSRSDALAWSVRLVGEHADEWLGQLREAMTEVDRLRGEGPAL